MEYVILKQLQESFFKEAEEFMWKNLNELESKHFDREGMELYMPAHILRMYETFLGMQFNYEKTNYTSKFCGVKIYNNYENSIVVSHKDLLIRKMEPYKLLIL